MKKLNYISLVIFIILISCGRQNTATTFRHTYFDSEGEILKTEEKSIQIDTVLDLEFYKKNFFKPYRFPDKFIDKNYKNETVVIWFDSNGVKDFNTNWAVSFFYDSLSRVTKYKYSGCLICSQLSYQIQIEYDKKNRPVRFQVNMTEKNAPPTEEFFLTYDKNGNIVKIKFLTYGMLDDQIEKIED